jgi:putative redox protein
LALQENRRGDENNECMTHKIDLNWKEEMSFAAEVNDHRIILDADEMVGGQNLGPRPKPLMLVALAGCTAMDVISILKKMKVEPEDFNVTVEGELTDEHPKIYHRIHVIYHFRGADLDPEKIEKAIHLSQDKYCGVSAMYREFATLTHEVRINS